MTRQEQFQIAGYFANPSRNTKIELEGKGSHISRYAPQYQNITGTALPIGTHFVGEWGEEADKYFHELRIYFSTDNAGAIPPAINTATTVGGRHGHEQWNKRLNRNELINWLFSIGFRIGHPQDETLIRSLIPAADLIDFNTGFAIP